MRTLVIVALCLLGLPAVFILAVGEPILYEPARPPSIHDRYRPSPLAALVHVVLSQFLSADPMERDILPAHHQWRCLSRNCLEQVGSPV